MIFRSVVGKLWITIIIFVSIILSLLSLFLIRYFDYYYYERQSTNLTNLATRLSTILTENPDNQNAVIMAKDLIEAYNNTKMTLFDKDSLDQKKLLQHGLTAKDIERVFVGETLVLRVIDPANQKSEQRNGDELLVVAVPIKQNQANEALILSQSLRGLYKSTKDTNKIILFFTAMGIVGTTIFAFFLSSRITDPIRQMQKAANRMAQGDFHTKVRIRSSDEIGDLAISFNRMASQLVETVQALSTEKEKLANILKSMADGVITINSEGKIIMTNPPAEKLFNHWHDEDNQLYTILKETLNEVLKGKVPISKDIQWNGQIFSIVMAPLYSGQVITGAVTLLREVTYERKLDKLRKDFLANVSHELRTPISMLQGYSEAIIDDIAQTDEEKKELAQIIYDESLRMGRLVNELLDLARMESGNIQLQYCKTNITVTLNKVIRKFSALAKDLGIELTTEVDPNIKEVFIDVDRIEQVITNLVDNAMRHTQRDGRITMRAKPKGIRKILLEVEDTGVGIPEEDLPYVFERFYKADKARTRGHSGTGLGLSIVKNIVHAHGGSISVSSQLGQGTTFSIILPTHNLTKE